MCKIFSQLLIFGILGNNSRHVVGKFAVLILVDGLAGAAWVALALTWSIPSGQILPGYFRVKARLVVLINRVGMALKPEPSKACRHLHTRDYNHRPDK